jgi:alpha-beta hydrolase superfamily lysophospholipase
VAVVPAPSDATLGELVVDGTRLRTLATGGTRAVVLLVGGIACESIEDGPLAVLASELARAGFVTVRFDKRGVGDSEGGPARDVDFATELADARAACEQARRRGLPVVVFGHSVGGIIAAQLPADAICVYGTPVRPWIECLLDSTRRQLALRGASDADIAERCAAITRLGETGELNGRSAAYHRQLAAVDLTALWSAVRVPVLVLRGEHDWVVADDDQAALATLTGGELVDLPGLDHVLGAHADREASLVDYGAGAPDRSVAQAVLAWLDRIMIDR